MGLLASCAIADIIVAIMTKRDVNYTPSGEMGDIGKTALQCQTVLYAQHDALAPPPFVGIQLSGRTGNTYMVGIGGSDTLYLVEYQIRIGFRRDAISVLFPAIDLR